MENGQKYDSTEDTLQHIYMVQILLRQIAQQLNERGKVHDKSKLEEPEKSEFDRLTPILKDLKYGSPEYQDSLNELQIALDHHYKHNSHHPQHYDNGIDGMDLLDIVEMFCDWKAATMRHKEGNFEKSIDINKNRFNMSEQLVNIFENTRKRLNW